MKAYLIDYNPNWGLNYVDNAVTSAVRRRLQIMDAVVYSLARPNEGQCRGYRVQ